MGKNYGKRRFRRRLENLARFRSAEKVGENEYFTIPISYFTPSKDMTNEKSSDESIATSLSQKLYDNLDNIFLVGACVYILYDMKFT